MKNKKKKVIHIMDELCWGGVNSFVRDLCHELKDLNYDVYVIIIMDSNSTYNDLVKKLDYKGINIQTLGARNKKQAIFKYIPKLRKKICDIAGNDITICNFHLRMSTLMGAVATIGKRNLRCVETYHSAYKFYTIQNLILRPLIDMYVPCSKSAEIEMKKRFNLKDRKIFLIPNGVNRNGLRAYIDETIKHSTSINVLSVGRFSNQKNFAVTANAFSNVCNSQIIYKIVGDGEEYSKVVQASGKNEYIKFTGNLTRREVIRELCNADIVVMPSLWEGLSIFMLESMAFDNPMIISEADSLINVFEEEKLKENEIFRICKWGYICKTNNPEAYEKALRHFVSHKEVWEGMRKEICSYSKIYDIKESAKKYSQLYENLLSDKELRD